MLFVTRVQFRCALTIFGRIRTPFFDAVKDARMYNSMKMLARAAIVAGALGCAPSALFAQELRLEAASLPMPLLVGGKVDRLIEASAV